MNFLKRSKNLKIQLSLSITLLVLVLISGMFIFAPISITQIANAISANYNKTSTDTLSEIEWNNLDDDFVAKSGDTIAGDLAITGDLSISGTCTGCGAAGGGGATYVNWGREDCPAGSSVIYSGYAFGSYYDKSGGTTNALCMQSQVSDAGSAASTFTSEIVPMGLASAAYLPVAMAPFERKEIMCAVCQINSTCYIAWNSGSCFGAGFSLVYTGWAMGGWTVAGRLMETNNYCINENFDNTSPNNNVWGSVLYGMEIEDRSDMPGTAPFTQGSYVKCAMCCN